MPYPLSQGHTELLIPQDLPHGAGEISKVFDMLWDDVIDGPITIEKVTKVMCDPETGIVPTKQPYWLITFARHEDIFAFSQLQKYINRRVKELLGGVEGSYIVNNPTGEPRYYA